MIDFQVHGSVKIKDAKKHSHSGILPKSQNAVTKKRGGGGGEKTGQNLCIRNKK